MTDQLSPAQLKTQVMAGADETKRYLDQLKKKVGDFDEKESGRPKEQQASKYLEDALMNAHKTIDELQETGRQLAGEPSSASVTDQGMSMVESGLQSSKDALHAIENRAIEYDAKYLGSHGSQTAGLVSDTVHDMVNAGRQRVMEAMDKANDVLQRIRQTTEQAAGQAKQSAQVVTGEAVKLAEKGDEMLGASDKAGGVVQGVKKLDERMHVTAAATKIDAKVTGGLGKKVVEKGMEIVSESVEYITETLHQAKLAASKSETAQAVEAKTGSMAESVAASAEQGKQMAQHTAEMAQDKASQAKDATMEKAGSAVDTARENAPDVSDRMQQGASKASEMAGQAKDKGGEVMDQAKDKGGDVAGQAKGVGSQAAGKAMEKGEQAMETAKQTKDSAMEKGEQAMESGKQTGQQAKDSVKATTKETTDSVKQTGQQAKDKAQEMTPGQSEGGDSGTVDKVGNKMKETASKAREAVTPSSSSAATATPKKDDAVSGDTKEVEAQAFIS